MSYFSHNPEALDDICIKAIAQRLYAETGIDDEEKRETILEVAAALYEARIPKARDTAVPSTVTEALMEWASEEMRDQEQAFWDSFIP